jgi:quercetin dioxygenase-like cupin family protein
MGVKKASEPIVLAEGEGRTGRIPGETFVAKASADDTEGHLAFAVVEFAPRHGTPSHRHPGSGESFYILSGEFINDIEDQEHRVSPGAFAFVPAGASHRITNIGDEPGRVIGFYTPAGPEKGFRVALDRAMELGRLPEIEEIRRIMEEHGTFNTGPARMRFDDTEGG